MLKVLRWVRRILGVGFLVVGFQKLPTDGWSFIVGLVIGLLLLSPEIVILVAALKKPDKAAEAAPPAPAEEPVVLSRKTLAGYSNDDSDVKMYDYDYDDVGIYRPEGVTFMPAVGDAVTLELEPDNPYDDKAVVAKVKGEHIGYLYRGKLKDMVVDFLNSPSAYIVAEVTRADSRVEIWIGMDR